MNNNMNCSYDGGDCCGPDVDTTYCSECQCCDDSGCNATSAGRYLEYFLKRDSNHRFLGKHGTITSYCKRQKVISNITKLIEISLNRL